MASVFGAAVRVNASNREGLRGALCFSRRWGHIAAALACWFVVAWICAASALHHAQSCLPQSLRAYDGGMMVFLILCSIDRIVFFLFCLGRGWACPGPVRPLAASAGPAGVTPAQSN